MGKADSLRVKLCGVSTQNWDLEQRWDIVSQTSIDIFIFSRDLGNPVRGKVLSRFVLSVFERTTASFEMKRLVSPAAKPLGP